ncbi:MAG: type II toxin-antitoxin system RelE/ParE family toxin [Vulcanimicrobiaceae bacterium]
MAWAVEYTDQFEAWYLALDEQQQDRIDFVVGLLEGKGPLLGRPYVDTIRASQYPNMKELRVQAAGDPIRVFFAFDLRRAAILLIGGDKTGDEQFYERLVPVADALYAEHLDELKREAAEK